MRRLVLVACGVLLLSAQAPPQADNPVLTHYRAYRAAIAAGDSAAAEREADSALQASVARDHDGGRTGVLAVNLAEIRLANQHTAEAYAPALQAFNIAAHTPSPGVDPLLARFVLGRAELTRDHDQSGRDRVLAALAEANANGREDLAGEAYAAAVDLGRRSMTQQKFSDAATAWSYAAGFATGALGDYRIAQAGARTAEGVSRYFFVVGRENQGGSGAPEAYRASAQALSEAIRILGPMSLTNGPGDSLSDVQRGYAQARAWRGVIDARLTSTGRDAVTEQHAASGLAVGSSQAVCPIHIVALPLPEYPATAAEQGQIGVVVLRILMDATGKVTDVRVAAAAPQEGFQAAVERVAPRWRVERAADAPPDCQVPRILFNSIIFALGSD